MIDIEVKNLTKHSYNLIQIINININILMFLTT